MNELIERLAREAGVQKYGIRSSDGKVRDVVFAFSEKSLARLVEVVAEEAAKVCDEKARRNFPLASANSGIYHAQADWAEHCAAAIRAKFKV